MDIPRRIQSLIAFHFGRPVAQRPHSDVAIRKATELAYRDVGRTIWGIRTHQDALTLKNQTHESIIQFVHDLQNIKSQAEFDKEHQKWCEKTIAFFQTHSHQTRESFEFHYGQAQKWLNMTLKYLAILGNPSVAGVYSYLHAPVDEDVYTRAALVLNLPAPRRGGEKWAWSRLDRQTYSAYQLSLRNAVAENSGGEDCVLDWEADEWIKAR